MSGPKISVYSLTGRAKAIVLGQMRCEQQSRACVSQTQAILKSLLSFSGNFDQQIQNIQLLLKRTGQGKEQLDRINHLQESLKRDTKEIEHELKANMPRVSTKYTITEEAYTQKQAELKKLQALQKRTESLKNALDDAFRNDKSNTSRIQASIVLDLSDPETETTEHPDFGYLKRDNEQNIQQIQRSIVDDLSDVYSFDFVDEPEAPDTSFADKKSAINKELSELLRDKTLPEDITKAINQAKFKLQTITELRSLTTFDAITVMGIFKKIDEYKHVLEQKQVAFEELVARYKALCAMAGEEAKEIPFTADTINVNAEIERLELILVRQREQEYIAECVDEVMAEMGYDLIGTREVLKKSGKRFRNELFTFNEGTAVNVTFSSDGQISMELGGISREDRIPTDEEADVLTRDMETFCGEFAEFERRLRERGVIIGNRIALSPPSEEYAAIINVNDYNISESAQISEMNIKEKRRKTAEKKVMRRDD